MSAVGLALVLAVVIAGAGAPAAGAGEASVEPGDITTYAGGGVGDGGPAAIANVSPRSIDFDAEGNLYIADSLNHRVRKVDLEGTITTVAGNGEWGYSGDGGPATEASLFAPWGVAADPDGVVYIADTFNDRVRRIDTDGIITTVAGTGSPGYGGDGGPATAARLDRPADVDLDPGGNLYVADWFNNRIRRVDTDGIITTVAGNGISAYAGDGGPATLASLSQPLDVAVDGEGNLYIADRFNYRVREVDAGGTITTVAGNGAHERFFGTSVAHSGDGLPAVLAAVVPSGVAVDADRNLYITHCAGCWRGGLHLGRGPGGPALRRVPLAEGPGAAITTVAHLPQARAVALDPEDTPHTTGDFVVHEIGPGGEPIPIAGTGFPNYGGDGWEATAARLSGPGGMAQDPGGNLYIADRFNHRVRKVDPSGIITLVAGNGRYESSGDGGPATSAGLRGPVGVAADADGNVFIAELLGGAIRRVDPDGTITTVAVDVSSPRDLAMDADGGLYIADSSDNRIRRLDPSGAVTTVAGSGNAGYSGDGGPATAATLSAPFAVAVRDGNLYIADGDGNRIRRVDPSGIITTVAGNGEWGYSGDGGPATQATLSFVWGLAVDTRGNLYIADRFNNRIRRVDPSGIITTVAGNGDRGYSGDGGPATQATLSHPHGLAVDTRGNLYIADPDSDRVRRVRAPAEEA